MEAREYKDEVFGHFARIGAAFGHAKRVEIVDVLAQGERSVESLAGQSTLALLYGDAGSAAEVAKSFQDFPGVVQRTDSVERDSFRSGLLDFPHYTRPAEVEGQGVPAVLLSGDHAAIERWRELEALRSTLEKRPDLLADAPLTAAQRRELARLQAATPPVGLP